MMMPRILRLLIGPATLGLTLAMAAPSAEAAAIGSAAVRATIQPALVGGSGFLLSSILIDDGSDPSTTYAFTDPPLGAGLAARSAASALWQGTGNEQLVLAAESSGRAVATTAGEPAAAFAAAQAHGGFLVSNLLGDAIDIALEIDWDLALTLALNEPSNEYAASLVQLTLFRDGQWFEEVAYEFIEWTDLGFGRSNNLSLPFSLAGGEEVRFTLQVTASILAQSTVVSSVPEPSSLLLASLAFLGWGATSRRCGPCKANLRHDLR
jgi:hypothetical protein